MRATRMAQWDGRKLWTTSLPSGALPEKMCYQGGALSAVQLFERLAVLETHALRS